MARKRRKVDSSLLVQDSIRAKELGLSYGEYKAYKERRELTMTLENRRKERQRLKSVDKVEVSYIGASKFKKKVSANDNGV